MRRPCFICKLTDECRIHLLDGSLVEAFIDKHPDGATLEDISQAMGVTKERIRQLEMQALMHAAAISLGTDAPDYAAEPEKARAFAAAMRAQLTAIRIEKSRRVMASKRKTEIAFSDHSGQTPDMPLKKGKSDKTREENIKREIEAGKDPRMAAAIAYGIQKSAQDKKAAAKRGK